MDGPLPDRIGQYEIVRRLAYGGMAEVLLGRLRGADRFQKYVVIKRILPQHCGNQEFVRMFRDEARITSKLHHGNIVQVLEFGESEGSYWLALEYVHGPSLGATLAELASRGRRLSVPEVAHIASEVARALDYAHRKRDEDGAPLLVVHRDVSPANVLISREGEVKLADFGIALARARLNPTLQAGVVKGKLSYMAPELLKGAEADPRSDLFALGAVLFEMLAGRRPFAGSNEAEIVQALLSAEIPRPSSFNPAAPPELDEIVMHLLRRSPEERPRRGLEVAEALGPLRRTEGFDAADRLAITIAELFPGDAPTGPETPTPSYIPRRGRVLVVDESRTTRALVRSVLRARYRVVEAEAIAEAMSVMRDEAPDAVVCQRSLRGGASVFELREQMADDPVLAAIPVILLAADPNVALEAEARTHGIAAVIPKSLDGLRGTLRDVIEHRKRD